MNRYGYLLAFILPIQVIVSCYLGGWWYFAPVVFVFGILTVFDQLLGLTTYNVPENDALRIGDAYFYRLLTYCWTYVQVLFVIGCAYWVATGGVKTGYEWFAFILSCSLVTGGIGITVAHELGHKKSTIEKLYSKVLLMTVCYMHFYVEHNKGHHVNVATPQDPATARKDENFFMFWIRSVFQSYTHAWTIENESWRRKKQSPLTVKNEMVWYTILPIL
jgi:alkane 1-monooxygenase